MCVVSMVGDHYTKEIPGWPYFPPQPDQSQPRTWPVVLKPDVTRAEFDELKRRVDEMKALLERAKEYDERNNEPHCEMDDKVILLRKVAELVGVDLADVFNKDTAH